MRRREFIASLGTAAVWPMPARAQQPAMPVVGYLGNYGFGGVGAFGEEITRAAVIKGLAETGFVEGRNVAIEYRWVEGQNERLPSILHDLIERRVAVLATVGSTAMALAAKAATQTIPIVFRIGGDPVARGLVPNLNMPGGNVTGATTLGVELGPKRLEMLRELLPTGATVALFTDPRNANAAAETREIEATAKVLGVRLVVLNASSPSELDAAFEKMAQQDVHGLLNAADPFIISQADRIVALAARRKIPGVYSTPLYFHAGGLMYYGASGLEAFRQVGTYVGRILKGEKPADLPVQQSTKVELGVNLKVAKAAGITIPTALLVRADEVIE
jgi:putative tryptophan/tyrosine transport system substrate-binding protein